MKDKRKRLGNRGEEIAEVFLKKAGYRIVERNFRSPFGEVDIVAEDRGCIVFVEVKTRSNLSYGLPAESIGVKKRHKISLVASYYLKSKNIKQRDSRFDVVSIVSSDGVDRVELIKDAFELTSP